jgi:hypothetical protein
VPVFSRLVRDMFRRMLGMEPPPVDLSEPPQRVTERLVSYAVEKAAKLLRPDGVTSDVDLESVAATMALEAVRVAAETVIEWFAPPGW